MNTNEIRKNAQTQTEKIFIALIIAEILLITAQFA